MVGAASPQAISIFPSPIMYQYTRITKGFTHKMLRPATKHVFVEVSP